MPWPVLVALHRHHTSTLRTQRDTQHTHSSMAKHEQWWNAGLARGDRSASECTTHGDHTTPDLRVSTAGRTLDTKTVSNTQARPC